MKRFKVIIDTNCLLQILGYKSPYHFIFEKLLNEEFIICISTDILLEYEEILKQKASPLAANLFLKVISRSKNVIHKDPYFRLEIIKQDFDDNKFVDCAFACQCDYIVTDDKHFSDAATSSFPRFRVVGLDDFAKIIMR